MRLAALIRGREVSPVEIVEAHLRRIERFNPLLNAVVTFAPDAIKRARESETAVMRGGELGPLHGVPLTVKDSIETRGLRSTSGSLLRATYVPDEDAAAVRRLRAAGAIILGKTNVPEMAIPYECDNPVFGRTNNPHDAARTSGGSSGGEAAAISARLSAAGLGSDLSGSVRVPAHFCGIVGLKPTAGRVPSHGHFPPVEGQLSRGAVLGPMARRVEDLTLLMSVLSGAGPGRHGAGQSEGPARLRGLRAAGFLGEALHAVTQETRRAVRAALRALDAAGLEVEEEEPPGFERAVALWPQLFLRESAAQLHGFYAGEEEKAGRLARAVLRSAADAKEQSTQGTDEPTSEARALSEVGAVSSAVYEWMERTPLIVAPVGAVPAFEHGARKVEVGGESISVFRAFGLCRAVNVLGLPSVAVPAGRSAEGLPIGIQIIGGAFQDELVLSAAAIVEEALGGWTEPKADFGLGVAD